MRALMVLMLLGCSSGAPAPRPDMASPDLGPMRITAGATSGTVTLQDADFSIDGHGSTTLGAFSIAHGSGTIELVGKSVPAAVYRRQAFTANNLRLYQTLAVESARMWVLWFYCSTTDNSLQGIYFENTDGTPVTFEAATGTCQDANVTSMVSVSFPAIDMPPPQLVPGYTIDGARVKLSGAMPGSVDLQTTLTVFVFNTVDCKTGCGTPGWTELHSLLWDAQAGRVCFGIFYLGLDDTSHVQLAYSLTLPSLTDPAGDLTLPANWTTP